MRPTSRLLNSKERSSLVRYASGKDRNFRGGAYHQICYGIMEERTVLTEVQIGVLYIYILVPIIREQDT